MILDKTNLNDIATYLISQNLLQPGETVLSAEKPGEGNMNYVLRLQLNDGSIIIKQARAYVEKYPTIPAPEERVIIEGAFYKKIAGTKELSSMMPAILKIDEENHIIILEDLGESSDFTFLYQQELQLGKEEAQSLAKYLSVLHNSFNTTEVSELMANRKLRALNHEHIFVYPLMTDNGFDLNNIQQGLQELSMKFKTNKQLKEKAANLGKLYLKDGHTLLHGDYYPGSWLKTSGGVKVIDPEFCFYGPAEFDLGVMIAHLKMAQQHDNIINEVIQSYKRPKDFNEDLLHDFIGIEIIRRIIGLAQLPLSLTLSEKASLLEEAMQLLNINEPVLLN
jgi:5-methylthioribose kinase